MTYYANSQHQLQTQPYETGIHTAHIRGVAASKSHQKGSVIIFTTPLYNGKRITINGMDSKTRGVRVYATVGDYRHNGSIQYAASSPRLIPGNYYASAGGSRGFEEFTIDANYVTQVHWTS